MLEAVEHVTLKFWLCRSAGVLTPNAAAGLGRGNPATNAAAVFSLGLGGVHPQAHAAAAQGEIPFLGISPYMTYPLDGTCVHMLWHVEIRCEQMLKYVFTNDAVKSAVRNAVNKCRDKVP